ncbi:hypothetical protein BDB01DRAFT_800799 [Pilobolus umbonatus]|nr:hypothetical protein BDB01DRAFT_800799 [Pilobolus umbonatus]
MTQEVISKDQEEDLSSAYIAQLLAQDAMAQGDEDYYAEYSNMKKQESYEASSEDDFVPKDKYIKKNGKRGRKRKVVDVAEIKEKEAIKKKDVIKKVSEDGFKTGMYTDSEEERFLEGLNIFGRNWPKIQTLVRTRDANSIRSHAQKHFIKLYRDDIPLPDKVKESGEGYTLSGNPLNLHSGAAKPYLSKKGISGDLPIPVKEPKEPKEPKAEQKEKKEKKEVMPVQEEKKTLRNYDTQGRTDYSTSKLRKQRESKKYEDLMKENSDPLTMIKCDSFTGEPGSDIVGSQPFKLEVDSNVLLSMDFHAHLMTTEIIGFLCGEWDGETKNMKVRGVYPCRSLNTGQNDINVEMDPTSAIEIRQLIEDRGMQVVGWYHSHPTFIPDPSLIDIENQRNYQMLCRDNTLEPFVGAIVGPYDPALPGSTSAINWFYVDQVPKKLIYELNSNTHLTQEEEERMLHLIPEYESSPERVVFTDTWRQENTENRLDKLIKSLGSRMPWISHSSDPFLERIQTLLKKWES